jgi:hypothetical protein
MKMAIHLPKKDFNDFANRIASMRDLQYASKDINNWEFTVHPRPWGAPTTMDHVFVGKDKTTGIEAFWAIDFAHAVDGHFDPEHQRIIAEFAQSLQALAHCIAVARAKQARIQVPNRKLVRPNTMKLLGRGDHLNRNRGY